MQNDNITYIQQLKDKHDKPQKAYVEYQLSKGLMRVFAHAKELPEDIKISMEIQEQINKYCEFLIANKESNLNVKLVDFLDMKNLPVPKFYQNYYEHLEFLGIDRNEFINLISGSHSLKLFESAKNISWETLEEVIKDENNNEAILDKEETTKILKNITDEYGLQSLTFGRIRCTNKSLSKLNEGLNQLSIVVDCHKEQVGANNFNLFFDSENCSYAGYSIQHFKMQKLYLNERMTDDAFAHEWLHGIDNMLATYHKLNEDYASETSFKSINDLLEKSKEFNVDAIDKIKAKVSENCLNSLKNIVDRFMQTGNVTKPSDFKDLIVNEYKKVLNNTWNKSEFIIECKKYQKSPGAIVSYLCSELELLKKVNNEKLDNSIFYNYAIIMDKNLNESNLIEGEYSTTKREMFARTFETYAENKLQEKGMKSVISKSLNNYIPSHEEAIIYVDKWKNVMGDINVMLNSICPIVKKENDNNLNISKILANIRSMKSKISDNIVKENKLKIG